MSSKRFKLEEVDRLPERKLLKAREPVYDEILDAVMKKDRGIFKVEVPGKKNKTVYSALIKRIRGKPLKLHVRENNIFLEKVE